MHADFTVDLCRELVGHRFPDQLGIAGHLL
jgi:hypothetical protein